MNKYFYIKSARSLRKTYIKVFGLFLLGTGLSSLTYFSFPVITSYALIQNVYASEQFTTPIPKINILTAGKIKNVLAGTMQSFKNIDYTNAKNWFPSYEIHPVTPRVEGYTISIPKIDIKDAYVSTRDYNVSSHLVNYGGTAVPPDQGNAVVFGHSTLPQFFSMSDYKTIFARLHLVEKGDKILVRVGGIAYTYTVTNLSVVSPEDFSPLMQEYDASYLTLITCTPPGTIWERLVVRATKSE